MKIYAFFLDGGVYMAKFTADGKRHSSAVIEQAGRFFVHSGMAISGDLQQYDLSEEETAVFLAYVKSRNQFGIELKPDGRWEEADL